MEDEIKLKDDESLADKDEIEWQSCKQKEKREKYGQKKSGIGNRGK